MMGVMQNNYDIVGKSKEIVCETREHMQIEYRPPKFSRDNIPTVDIDMSPVI